jgi:hypothetical protein
LEEENPERAQWGFCFEEERERERERERDRKREQTLQIYRMFTLYKLRTDKCVLMRKLPQSWERIYQKE